MATAIYPQLQLPADNSNDRCRKQITQYSGFWYFQRIFTGQGNPPHNCDYEFKPHNRPSLTDASAGAGDGDLEANGFVMAFMFLYFYQDGILQQSTIEFPDGLFYGLVQNLQVTLQAKACTTPRSLLSTSELTFA